MSSQLDPAALRTGSQGLDRARNPFFALFLGVSVLAIGCGPDSKGPQPSTEVETLRVSGDLPGAGFLVDSNQVGRAAQLGLEGLYWGRLVDVHDADGVLRHRDFVIGEGVRSDGADFVLDEESPSDRDVLRVLHPFASTAYVEALERAQRGLARIEPKGTGPAELPPFAVVPRNAALVLRFDDILGVRYQAGAWRDDADGRLISASSGQLAADVVRLVEAKSPGRPIAARVFASPNHGDVYDLGDGPAFYPTRVIVSATIRESDAAQSDPPLEVQAMGLPAGGSELVANVALRLPTHPDPASGQGVVLTNPAGRGLALEAHSTGMTTGFTREVVRAFASGGSGQINQGFLLDTTAPYVVSGLDVELEDDDPNDAIPAVTDLGGGLFEVRQVRFLAAACTTILKPGRDVIEQGGTRALVLAAQQASGALQGVVLQVLSPAGGSVGIGAARYQSPFAAANDPAACFVRFSVAAGSPPDQGVPKSAQVILRFSEPLDPGTLSAFDNLTITRRRTDSPLLTNFDYVVGTVRVSPDLREFAFAPALPLDRSQGFSESDVSAPGTYHVTLLGGADGPKDLAGNALNLAALRTPFFLDPSEPVSTNAGLVLRFDSRNEILFNASDEAQGWGELRDGQIQFDTGQSAIRPRPVSRFSAAADRDKPVPSVMTPFPAGVQTPLSPLGSKLQALWRYVDVGWSLLDESLFNVDVEGLAWAPVGGGVITDSYDEFSIRLGHSKWLPDETPDPMTLFPIYPMSGLVPTYADNYLDSTPVDGTLVHPQQRGYVVSPANMFTAASGTAMQPFPLNRGIPASEFQYYTWRDTAMAGTGGSASSGAIQRIESLVVHGNTLPAGVPYSAGEVPTIGLPLMVEYRCYPDSNALGLNLLDVSLAINSSIRPNFRAFSTGGFNTLGNPVVKHPDAETTATGGFGPGGSPTSPADSLFYIGQVELVTRISRTHSIWFDTGLTSPKYVRPILEVLQGQLPAGTQLQFAFRGALDVTTGGSDDNIRTNAARLDPYGNPLGNGVGQPVYPANNPEGQWRETIQQIDDSRFFQVRVTFLSNAATSETPSLSSLGFAYRD